MGTFIESVMCGGGSGRRPFIWVQGAHRTARQVNTGSAKRHRHGRCNNASTEDCRAGTSNLRNWDSEGQELLTLGGGTHMNISTTANLPPGHMKMRILRSIYRPLSPRSLTLDLTVGPDVLSVPNSGTVWSWRYQHDLGSGFIGPLWCQKVKRSDLKLRRGLDVSEHD